MLYFFEDYALDTQRRELRQGATLLSMEPQVFDLPAFLVGNPDRVDAHYAKGNLLRQKRRCEEAIPEYEAVIELDRNEPGAYANLGWCKLLTG